VNLRLFSARISPGAAHSRMLPFASKLFLHAGYSRLISDFIGATCTHLTNETLRLHLGPNALVLVKVQP
jgi:hypothetical protein